MSATILLIRHAAHGHLGTILSGRTPGIPLSDEGRRQADRLSARLAELPLAALHTSPVQRARETAQAVAGRKPGLAAEEHGGLDEIDFGTWTGRPFTELSADPGWERWNRDRAWATPPAGESMARAQRRAWRHVTETAARYPEQTVAMVSHCDIIRSIIVQILALPLDAVHRFDIDPASISRVLIASWGAKVLSLNEGVR